MLPADVCQELLTSICLSAFWGVDMALPFLPFIAATDASDEFGIGACISDSTIDYVQQLARKAETSGTYVTLQDIEPKHRSRSLGSPVAIDKCIAIFAIQRSDTEHINLREARAVVQFLKWVPRSSSRHCSKIVLLVDSRVVVGAVAKGRSGSFTLNAFLKRIAALTMAGGLVLSVIFVPTEFNPADFSVPRVADSWQARSGSADPSLPRLQFPT